MTDLIPRRNRVNERFPAETTIAAAVAETEKVGAHPVLTDAVVLLGHAADKVGDMIDKVCPVEPRFSVKLMSGRFFIVDRDDDRPMASTYYEDDANNVCYALNLVTTSRSQPARPKR